MKTNSHPAPEAHEEFVTDCGGIQPIFPDLSWDDCILREPAFGSNELIEQAIQTLIQQNTAEAFFNLCLAIRSLIEQDGHFIFPADISKDACGNTEFSFKTLDLDTDTAIVAFTNPVEKEKAPPAGAVSYFIDSALEDLMQMEEIQGIVLNPFGDAMFLSKNAIEIILAPDIEQHIKGLMQ